MGFERFQGRLLTAICVCPDNFLGHLACSNQLPGGPDITSTASVTVRTIYPVSLFRIYIGTFSQFRPNLAADLNLGGRSFSVGRVRILSYRFGCQCPCRPANLLESCVPEYYSEKTRLYVKTSRNVYASSETSIIIA